VIRRGPAAGFRAEYEQRVFGIGGGELVPLAAMAALASLILCLLLRRR